MDQDMDLDHISSQIALSLQKKITHTLDQKNV